MLGPGRPGCLPGRCLPPALALCRAPGSGLARALAGPPGSLWPGAGGAAPGLALPVCWHWLRRAGPAWERQTQPGSGRGRGHAGRVPGSERRHLAPHRGLPLTPLGIKPCRGPARPSQESHCSSPAPHVHPAPGRSPRALTQLGPSEEPPAGTPGRRNRRAAETQHGPVQLPQEMQGRPGADRRGEGHRDRHQQLPALRGEGPQGVPDPQRAQGAGGAAAASPLEARLLAG